MSSRVFGRFVMAAVLAGFGAGCGTWSSSPDIPSLVAKLRSTNPSERGPANVELIRLGEQAAVPVSELLKDPDPKIRHIAALTLSSMGARARPATAALIAALDDSSDDVRIAAATALQPLGRDAAPAVAKLTQLLRASNGTLRREAARALGEIGAPAASAVPALIQASKNDYMQDAADEAVRKIQSSR
jgi:HEAT repeat protein